MQTPLEFLDGGGCIILLGLIDIDFIWWLKSNTLWDEF
jgi:hypothetical protein